MKIVAVKISKKMRVFSDRLFDSSHGRGEVAPVADVEVGGVGWVGNIGMGVTALWGWDNIGGTTVGVSSTSKNRPSHHKNKSPKQSQLKQS